ncbi:MAG: hypothetical protein JJT75_13665 [Opitutales bacterium]|nr:hypothetical protein [Opitutales bacterium]MCH8540485.1 hypothetical protein [Opitutales bacterium]
MPTALCPSRLAKTVWSAGRRTALGLWIFVLSNLAAPPLVHAGEDSFWREDLPPSIQEAWKNWSPLWSPSFSAEANLFLFDNLTLPWQEEYQKHWQVFLASGQTPLQGEGPTARAWGYILNEFSEKTAESDNFHGWNSQQIHRFLEQLQGVPSSADPLFEEVTEKLLELLNEHIKRRQTEQIIQNRIHSLQQAIRRTSDPITEESLGHQKETLRKDLEILKAEERKTIDDWNRIVLLSFRQRHYLIVTLLDRLIDYLHPQAQRFASQLSATARAKTDKAEQILATIEATDREIKVALENNDIANAFLRGSELFFLATYHPGLGETYLPPHERHHLQAYFLQIQKIRHSLNQRDWTTALEKLQDEPWLSHPTEEWEQVVTSVESIRGEASELLQQSRVDVRQENYEAALLKKQRAQYKWPHNPGFQDQMEEWVLHLQGHVLHLRETSDHHQQQEELQEILNRQGQLVYTLLRPYPKLEEQYTQILTRLDEKMIPYQDFLRQLSIAREKTEKGAYLAARRILDDLAESHGNSEDLATVELFLQKAINHEIRREKMFAFRRQGQVAVALSHAEAAALDATTLQVTRKSLANSLLQKFQKRNPTP